MGGTDNTVQKGAKKDAQEAPKTNESPAVEKAVENTSKAQEAAKTYSEAEYNDINDQLTDSKKQYDELSVDVKTKDQRIAELEKQLKDKQEPEPSKPSPKANKSVVVAVKDGVEREFPLLAWKNMPKDKGGWKHKVKTPKEAK